MSDLQGKSFVVGGASRGIGRAISAELVGAGARVLMLSRSSESIEAAAAELGDLATPLAADMAAPDTAERVRAAVGEWLDGVVVNSGGPPLGQALDLGDDVWRGAYELLLGGPLRLLRELVPLMGEGGAILFVTSSSVRQAIDGLDTSNVLRPGVAALAKVLARELGPRGIRVNSMAPGRIDTDRVRSNDEARAERTGKSVEEVRRDAEEQIPLRRYGEPEELGRVGAFLLSGAASYVSGAAIQVDGGLVTAVP
ncbi:MAG: 3-oxoacyl-[acyl-carrier protein] reductase [Thermoleophilaceae bacterium]|nr:3-oxoacyl-[acyl-carrier protein] reductase [Thermoleophilaceae bacterium]